MNILRFADEVKVSGWVADAAFGVIIGRYSDIEIPIIKEAAEACGGSVTFFARASRQRWRKDDVEEAMLRAIRNAFDSVG